MSLVNEVFLADRIEYLNSFPDKFFDWIVDDPPYFSGPEKRKFYGKSQSSIGVNRLYAKTEEWEVPKADYFDLLIQKSKNQIIWGCNYYEYQFGPGRIVWDKVNGDSSFSDCELAYCSSHDSVRMFKFMWNGMLQGLNFKNGTTMLGNKKLNEKRIHPTQKPIELYKWIYNTYIEKGQTIGDFHVGSGSNRIVAYDYGCNFYGCEKTDIHFNNQQKRFEQHTRQQSLFSPTQLTL